jgi:hypothetical protein
VDWLTSLPVGLLVVGSLVFAVSVALAARVGVRRLVPTAEHDHVPQIAAPLMPALGAAFGILMALTVASEAGYLKSAQEIVAGEAAAASRLAWAATSSDVQSEPIHDALQDYLEATRESEWHDDDATRSNRRVVATLATLERRVRTEASRKDLSTPQATELLTALDSLTSGRRSRIAAASRQIPLVYVITLITSGVALIVNAGALGLRSSLRTSSLVLGLAIVVGLSLALMFSLTAPWRGGLTVGTEPIDSIIDDLRDQIFR